MKFGLALGGGGARGYAHVGVLRVLERENLQPDVIAGTSMGGLIGAFMAAGHNSQQIQAVIGELSFQRLLDINPLKDLLRGSELRRVLETHLPERFEELERPFCVTATDLIAGNQVYLHSGNLFEAVACTIAFPGAIDPSWVGEQLLSDGGILNQVPVDAVRFLGANRILAIDVTPLQRLELSSEEKPVRWWEHLLGRDRNMTATQTLMRALEVMQHQMTETQLAIYPPDVLLRPKLDGIGLFSFTRFKEAIEAGEQTANEHLGRLRQKLV